MGSRHRVLRSALAAAVAMAILAAPASAQDKAKGGGNEKDRARRAEHAVPAKDRNQGQGKATGRLRDEPSASASRGEGRGKVRATIKDERREARSEARIERRIEREFAGDVDITRGKVRGNDRGRLVRHVTVYDLTPSLRRFYSDRLPAKAAVGAVARAHLRGVSDNAFIIAPVSDRVLIRNRTGVVLVDLDDRRVRDLGRWDVDRLRDETKEGSPSFCRSGAGHPVWGRQWCLDKGFGLGADNGYLWGRATRADDIVFRRGSTGSLVGDALVGLLGQTAFDRLALHAITLGFSDPISGRWLGEPTGTGPRVLLLQSGQRPVAEVVDLNGDDRADLMLVALRDY